MEADNEANPGEPKYSDYDYFLGWGAILLIIGLLMCGLLGRWETSEPEPTSTPTLSATATADPSVFRILAEGGVKPLEESGILADFTDETGIKLDVQYGGPIQIRNAIQAINEKRTPGIEVDAYWPGSSIWLTGSTTVTPETVMKTYMVLAVDQQAAHDLGWDTAESVTVPDLVEAIRTKKIALTMTSATQSTPGAAFYLAAYTAMTGKPVLTSPDLQNTALTERIGRLFKGIARSAKDLDLLEYVYILDKTSGSYKLNAIVMYESLAIDMNRKLVAAGQEPTRIFYLEGATAIADAPLRYVDRKDDNRLAQYEKLVAFLRRNDIQMRIQALGWRTNRIGMRCEQCPDSVFKPEWGIDKLTEFPRMIFPKPHVTEAALNFCQSGGCKARYTAYCLDYSGSMEPNGRLQVAAAMGQLLDQKQAAKVLLQASPDDVTVVYGFARIPQQIGPVVRGNSQGQLISLSIQIQQYKDGSGTAMFDCVKRALLEIGDQPDDSLLYSVIAMTDGLSNEGATAAQFEAFYKQGGYSTPVCGIAFGDADFTQLALFQKLGGAAYDGRKDPAQAFLDCKGSN